MTGCQVLDIPSSCHPVILTTSMPAVPVVPALGPIVGRTDVGPADGGDPLDVLYAVLDGERQAQRPRHAVFGRPGGEPFPPPQARGGGDAGNDEVAARAAADLGVDRGV